MATSELERQLVLRLRRHILTTLAGLVAAIGLAGVVGGVAELAFDGVPPAWLRVFPVVAIALVAGVGICSSFKYLRCPSCERTVVWQTSMNFSLFAAAASKSCAACGQKIFSDGTGRGVRILMILAIALGAAAAVLTSLRRH